MKKLLILVVALGLTGAAIYGNSQWSKQKLADQGLSEVANGDAQFWLMQGPPNNRYIPCVVYYKFDQPLNEAMVLARLKEMASTYRMFQHNIVEVDGLPYWQSVDDDWSKLFRILAPDEDIERVRAAAEEAVSQASPVGEGQPLFRSFLSADRTQLVFVWHHVISDLEGMFNKHAKHLFGNDVERTKFGYQLDDETIKDEKSNDTAPRVTAMASDNYRTKRLGFVGADYETQRLVLPIQDQALYQLGRKADLPMSDIFSLISLRAVTLYELALVRGDIAVADKPVPSPMISPISLRKSSLDLDEGNNRAVRSFPFIFPLEPVQQMYDRVLAMEPTAASYDQAGRAMKLMRRLSVIEPFFRRKTMPEYISNYFPLADMQLTIGSANLMAHQLRVPMVPFESTKFAWSNYDGEVQLFLHTDPELIDAAAMRSAYETALNDVLTFLRDQ